MWGKSNDLQYTDNDWRGDDTDSDVIQLYGDTGSEDDLDVEDRLEYEDDDEDNN